MSRHTITAKRDVLFWFPGLAEDERESANVTIDIVFDYVAPVPEQKWEADLSLVSATLISGDGLDPTDAQVKEWAQDWLDDAGYDACCQLAEAVPAC